jgi:hypothetical protein
VTIVETATALANSAVVLEPAEMQARRQKNPEANSSGTAAGSLVGVKALVHSVYRLVASARYSLRSSQ